MVIAFQTVLIVTMILTLMGIIGEKKDINLRNKLSALFVSSIIAFIISVLFL